MKYRYYLGLSDSSKCYNFDTNTFVYWVHPSDSIGILQTDYMLVYNKLQELKKSYPTIELITR